MTHFGLSAETKSGPGGPLVEKRKIVRASH
jgi:hypothetical protein